MTYNRSGDFVLPGGGRSHRKMNAELDLIAAAFAQMLVNPSFSGEARAITRAITDNSTLLATTAFVHDLWAGVVGGLPLMTGQSGKWLTNNGTTANWALFPVKTLSIFSAETASLQPLSSMERMENGIHSTGLSTVCSRIAYGSGDALFVASSDSAQSNVASSADGQTWTLRAMPSSAAWCVATDGAQWTATALNSTAVANSADGITWSTDTALPAVAHASLGVPAFVGSRVLVLGNTSATAFYSDDYGHIWSAAQTLPAAAGSTLYVVGGLFWYWASGTTAYTSATGATGSWTARTLPVTPSSSTIWQDFDGALIVLAASSPTGYYRSTDGINWTAWAIGQPNTTIAGHKVLTINGVYAEFSTTFGEAASRHNGEWIRRFSLMSASLGSTARIAKNAAGTIFLIPEGGASAGDVGRIEPAAGDAATGVFMDP